MDEKPNPYEAPQEAKEHQPPRFRKRIILVVPPLLLGSLSFAAVAFTIYLRPLHPEMALGMFTAMGTAYLLAAWAWAVGRWWLGAIAIGIAIIAPMLAP